MSVTAESKAAGERTATGSEVQELAHPWAWSCDVEIRKHR